MPWAAAATVGVGVIGAMSSASAADSASASSDRATDAQSKAAADELAWAKEQQRDWDEIFGPTQEILSEYYNTLDPQQEADKQIMTGVQEMQRGYQDYQKQQDIVMTQRGMNDSGLQAELDSQAMYMNEANKANFRANAMNTADANVAGQQASFLQLGLNQAQGVNQNISNAYSGQTSTLGMQANQANQNNLLAQQNQAQSMNTLGQSVGNLVGSFGNQNSSLFSTMPTTGGTNYNYQQYAGGPTWG